LFSEENPLSPRLVIELLTHLPSDSALAASRRGGPQYRGWDADRYALAALVNAQRANNHILMMVNRDPKKPKPKPPDSFPMPDDDKPKPLKPGSFAAIAASMIEAQRKKEQQSA